MSKKSSKRRRRSRSSSRQTQAPVRQAAPKQATPKQAAPKQAAPAPSRSAAAVAESKPVAPDTAALASEYRYVTSDLRRIGILAASMLVLLVVLALAAQYVF